MDSLWEFKLGHRFRHPTRGSQTGKSRHHQPQSRIPIDAGRVSTPRLHGDLPLQRVLRGQFRLLVVLHRQHGMFSLQRLQLPLVRDRQQREPSLHHSGFRTNPHLEVREGREREFRIGHGVGRRHRDHTQRGLRKRRRELDLRCLWTLPARTW